MSHVKELGETVSVGYECPECHGHHTAIVPREKFGKLKTYAFCTVVQPTDIVTIHTDEVEDCTVCRKPMDYDVDPHSTETGWCHPDCCEVCSPGQIPLFGGAA